MKDFSKKYKHIGYSHLSIPEGWIPTVKKALIEIEKTMWPRWIPMFVKRWIYWLAMGRSIVRVRSWWWYHNVYQKLVVGMVTDLKEKYASMRIDGSFTEEQWKIADEASDKCDNICQDCGSEDDVKVYDKGWMYNLCKECREKYKKSGR